MPVQNQTEQELEIRANEVIARWVSIVQAPQVEPEQLNQSLTYGDIEKLEKKVWTQNNKSSCWTY